MTLTDLLDATRATQLQLVAAIFLTLAIFLKLIWVNQRLRGKVKRLEEQWGELERAVVLDSLTGLHTRYVLGSWLGSTHRGNGTVVLLDVDSFRDIVARMGIESGNEVLQLVGHLIRSSIGSRDFACRWGADEFVLYFDEEDTRLVEERIEEIARRLRDFKFHDRQKLPVRISWGVTQVTTGNIEEAIALADAEMYQRKGARKQQTAAGQRWDYDRPPDGGVNVESLTGLWDGVSR